MKKLYFLFAAGLYSLGVAAKTTSIGSPDVYPHFDPQVLVTGTTPANVRIVGETYFTFNGAAFEAVDSTTFSYSNGRGGLLTADEFDDKYVNFDESYTYVYTAGTYHNSQKRFQSYDVNNNSQMYSYQKWKEIGVATPYWKDFGRYEYTYNPAKLVTSAVFELWHDGGIWEDHAVYDNVYDLDNNVIEMNSTDRNILFSYDADNRMIQRTDIVAYGLTGFWENDQKVDFTYGADGKLAYYIISKWHNNTWNDSAKLAYNYNGQDILETVESVWNGSSWANSGVNEFAYDGAHNKLSDVRMNWDDASNAYINAYRTDWTYNSFDQPTTVSTNTWNTGSASWQYSTDDYQLHLYYETYSPTGIHQLPQAGVAMRLYPIPAQDVLNIDMTWEKAQPYSLSVFDMQGRQLKSFSEPAATNVQKSIPVNDLPAGNYFIKISGTIGQHIEKFTVNH